MALECSNDQGRHSSQSSGKDRQGNSPLGSTRVTSTMIGEAQGAMGVQKKAANPALGRDPGMIHTDYLLYLLAKSNINLLNEMSLCQAL